ncbi:hypothetical protein ACRALDRAFT_205984 [Sodiomyces alcalophilus JCM 7366]|uniref:uncharacterized protein n=1 Tax=Sodiomyces alcalophilus JCM 7366 TaxID=591952 RepID=UPI0039B4BB6C
MFHPRTPKPARGIGGSFGRLVPAEERERRATESIKNIREEATYTPPLLAAVTDRITTNSFRRLLSDNAIYTRITNALRDENMPETDRHPGIVDFLALEAILPVNYNGVYNRPLNALYERCDTLAWVERQLLTENHEYFASDLAAAKDFVLSLVEVGIGENDGNGDAGDGDGNNRHDDNNNDDINNRGKDGITRDLSEDVMADINNNYWRQDRNKHALVAACFAKMEKQEELTAREVIGVVAVFHGQYPAKLVTHLIDQQNSAYLKFGDVDDAAHAFEHDPAYGEDYREAQHLAQVLHAATSYAEEYEERNDTTQAAAWRQRATDLVAEHGKASQILRIVRSGRVRKRGARVNPSERFRAAADTTGATGTAIDTNMYTASPPVPPLPVAQRGPFLHTPVPTVESVNPTPPRRGRGRPRKNPVFEATALTSTIPGTSPHMTQWSQPFQPSHTATRHPSNVTDLFVHDAQPRETTQAPYPGSSGLAEPSRSVTFANPGERTQGDTFSDLVFIKQESEDEASSFWRDGLMHGTNGFAARISMGRFEYRERAGVEFKPLRFGSGYVATARQVKDKSTDILHEIDMEKKESFREYTRNQQLHKQKKPTVQGHGLSIESSPTPPLKYVVPRKRHLRSRHSTSPALDFSPLENTQPSSTLEENGEKKEKKPKRQKDDHHVFPRQLSTGCQTGLPETKSLHSPPSSLPSSSPSSPSSRQLSQLSSQQYGHGYLGAHGRNSPASAFLPREDWQSDRLMPKRRANMTMTAEYDEVIRHAVQTSAGVESSMDYITTHLESLGRLPRPTPVFSEPPEQSIARVVRGAAKDQKKEKKREKGEEKEEKKREKVEEKEEKKSQKHEEKKTDEEKKEETETKREANDDYDDDDDWCRVDLTDAVPESKVAMTILSAFDDGTPMSDEEKRDRVIDMLEVKLHTLMRVHASTTVPVKKKNAIWNGYVSQLEALVPKMKLPTTNISELLLFEVWTRYSLSLGDVGVQGWMEMQSYELVHIYFSCSYIFLVMNPYAYVCLWGSHRSYRDFCLVSHSTFLVLVATLLDLATCDSKGTSTNDSRSRTYHLVPSLASSPLSSNQSTTRPTCSIAHHDARPANHLPRPPRELRTSTPPLQNVMLHSSRESTANLFKVYLALFLELVPLPPLVQEQIVPVVSILPDLCIPPCPISPLTLPSLASPHLSTCLSTLHPP